MDFIQKLIGENKMKMKLIRKGLLVGASVLAMVWSANAFAAYDYNYLKLSAYAENDKETMIQLDVDLKTYDFAGARNDVVTNASTGSLSLSQFSPGKTWSDINVAFWGSSEMDQYDPANAMYFATVTSATPIASTAGINGFMSGKNIIEPYYNVLKEGTGYPAVGPAKANGVATYHVAMNENGFNPGSFAGLNQDPNNVKAEKNLHDFEEAGIQWVDLYLHKVIGDDWDIPTQVFGNIATIRLFEDGQVVVNPGAVVPIPGAALLFGSALLGLAGIRRKIA